VDQVLDKLTEQKLIKYLEESKLILSSNSQLTVKQYSNGYSNLTYLLQIEGKEFVLRRPPQGAVKRGHDMSREFKVLAALEDQYEIAPKPFLFEANTEILGAPFYLMEKIEGIILTAKEAHNLKLKKTDFDLISDTWIKMFVSLHQVTYEQIGLVDLGRPNGYVERQVANWGKQYQKAATQQLPNAEKLMAWMIENQPKEYDHTFIHNDFKYDNVVFKDNTWRKISAVLDWEMCTIGDPLMDLGTSLAYWITTADGPAKNLIPSPTIMDGNPSRSDIVEMYSQLSGRQINNIVFYYAFGLFKIAVIAQQIFYRYQAGFTSNPKFAHLDKACALFCEMGWNAVQKNRIENYN